MKIVKLTFNYDWPLFRQTPNFSGIWGDYKFVIDDNLKECDYWVVYSEFNLKREECVCDKTNIIFIPAEGYETSPRFSKDFLKQFGRIITVQRQIKGKNVMYWQNANPWFVERSYDELINLKIPEKTKLISVVSSDKAFTEGHRRRIKFCEELKKHFGDRMDFFGRGIRDFENKWDVLAPYKYHIAIENDFLEDWVTEKFFDPLLTYTFPLYYGCPNLSKYISENSFKRIDINDCQKAINIIEIAINDDLYGEFITNIDEYRETALNEQQFFPMLAYFLKQLEKGNEKNLNIIEPSIISKENILRKIKRKIKSIYKP